MGSCRGGGEGRGEEAQVLGATETLNVVREGDELVVTLPPKAADAIDTVVAMEVAGK